MNRYRTWLSVLLGVVLLVQGFAVSAAPHAAAAASHEAEVPAMAQMPCHAQQQATAAQEPGACCNASCPDMTHCALGHLACAAAVAVVVPPPGRSERGFTPAGVALRPLPSLLRPPIVVHV